MSRKGSRDLLRENNDAHTVRHFHIKMMRINMALYTIRKSKKECFHIVSFKKKFLELISEADGWCIRVLIAKIIKDLSALKGRVVIDADSQDLINEVISKNGDFVFSEPGDYSISLFFIDGLMTSNSGMDYERMFGLITKFYKMLKKDKSQD